MLDLANNEIGALFVLPGFTGRGIGKQVLVYLEALARELGIKEVILDATLNAADFYRRCGYVGDEQAIYHSPSGWSWWRRLSGCARRWWPAMPKRSAQSG